MNNLQFDVKGKIQSKCHQVFTEVKISFLDFPNIPCKKTYIVIAIKIIAPSGRMMSPKARIAL